MSTLTTLLRRSRPATDAIRAARPSSTSKRTFSRCAVCSAYSCYPSFTPTSDPTLDALLVEMRYKHMLPHYLPPDQKKMVTKGKFGLQAEREGTTVRVGGIQEKLRYVAISDIPAKSNLLQQAVKLAKEPEDWQNIYRLLEGFEGAGQEGRLSHQKKIWLLAKLVSAGQTHLVIQAVVHADRTGISLANPQALQLVLEGINKLAAREEADESESKLAPKYAQEVIKLLETKEHAANKASGEMDPRRHPAVTALPLKLYASLLLQDKQNGALQAKAQSYFDRLMGLVEEDSLLTSNKIEESLHDNGNEYEAASAVSALEAWGIVYQSLSIAQEALGSGISNPTSARDLSNKLKVLLSDALNNMKEKTPWEGSRSKLLADFEKRMNLTT